MANEQNMTEAERLKLITDMIARAKNSFHDSGLGPILWGCVISLCGLTTFAQIEFGFDLPFDIWLLTLLAIVPQVILVNREKRQRKARSHDERTMDAIWVVFGFGIFMLIFLHYHTFQALAPATRMYRSTQPDAWGFSDMSTGYFLFLYGIPTLLTGSIRRFKPMLIGGVVCWVLAVASMYTSLRIDMLFTAIAAISAWLIPGIILRRTYLKNRRSHV